MKKAISILLIGCSILIFSACKSPTAKEQQETSSILIGVSVYDPYDTFIKLLMEDFHRLAKEKEQNDNVTITIIQENAGGDQVAQNSQVEKFIQAGCDVICLNLVDRTDATVAIDKARAAGIPILFFNRELVEEDLNRWDNLYYVGAKALDSGRMQGEIVAALCEEDFQAVDRNNDGVLQYVMLEGEAGHQDAVVRTEFSINALRSKGYELERLEDEIANWIRAQAETKMVQWIERHGSEIEVVFANNDDMALGAIDALKKAGVQKENWPVVVGIDGTPVGLEAVVAGEMTGTVFNDSEGQAESLLELAYALTQNLPLPEMEQGRYIRLPYQIVTKDNVKDFIGKDASSS